MPHIIIEHSRLEVSSEQLMTAVNLGALNSQLFDPDDIKVRTMCYQNPQCGDLGLAFVHVIARVLSGRELLQRKMLSHHILKELQNLGLKGISLTVEIVEIEKGSYAKSVHT